MVVRLVLTPKVNLTQLQSDIGERSCTCIYVTDRLLTAGRFVSGPTRL